MLHRRLLIKGLAAATLAPAMMTANRCFADARDRLQLGLVTYNWGKDWDIPTIIKNCQKTGFTGVELRSTHRHGVEISLNEDERADVRARFENSDVQLVGLGSACEYHSDDPAKLKKNIEETKAFVRLCHDVGGSGVKVRPNGFPKGVPIEKTLHQIGVSLKEVGEYGERFGVQIRLEVHGHGTSELPHIKTMMDIADHSNVVLCWNCNPTDLIGEGFDHNFDLVREQIGTIHIHDLRDNAYPWVKLFEKLKQLETQAFTGWTLLEDGKVPKDIVQAMHANKEAWNAIVHG